jgi:hypothetical protein
VLFLAAREENSETKRTKKKLPPKRMAEADIGRRERRGKVPPERIADAGGGETKLAA